MKIKFLIVAMIAAIPFLFTACGGDDDSPSVTTRGLYIQKGKCASQADFKELEKAIDNDELLYSSGYSKTYASVEAFLYSDGTFGDTKPNLGRFRFFLGKKSQINAIRFEGNSTVILYNAYLCRDAGSRHPVYGEAIYSFYAGKNFGQMTYYANPLYKTFVSYDDKYVTLDGDIIYKVGNAYRFNNDDDLYEKI